MIAGACNHLEAADPVAIGHASRGDRPVAWRPPSRRRSAGFGSLSLSARRCGCASTPSGSRAPPSGTSPSRRAPRASCFLPAILPPPRPGRGCAPRRRPTCRRCSPTISRRTIIVRWDRQARSTAEQLKALDKAIRSQSQYKIEVAWFGLTPRAHEYLSVGLEVARRRGDLVRYRGPSRKLRPSSRSRCWRASCSRSFCPTRSTPFPGAAVPPEHPTRRGPGQGPRRLLPDHRGYQRRGLSGGGEAHARRARCGPNVLEHRSLDV